GSVRKRPGDGGRNVVGCFSQPELLMCPEPAVHLHAELNVFSTQIAAFGPSCQREWAADPDGIAELDRLVLTVLFSDEVLGNRPALKMTAKYQLRFKLSISLVPRLGVRFGKILIAVVVYDFEQALVRAIDVLEFDVQDGIDPVLSRE